MIAGKDCRYRSEACGIGPMLDALKARPGEEIHATRFKSLFRCLSLPQNRCAVLGDMH
ncbi:conserved hypothetical protein [Mesorhizobium ventifaucium]|uniref:Uncharacterized protein n=1 Tax=Mesorhizobium ventifaucium TaxID=666020 RepID=A0ABN8KFA6_9HYPH|nr:conserved hypothetical protein [Mesorhizobium ventifaucium]